MHLCQLLFVVVLVSEKHTYRKLKQQPDFVRVAGSVKIKENDVGAIGFGKQRLITCLILQFMEDLSDREFERFIPTIKPRP